MRLRYAGTCAGCGCALVPGDRAHYLRATKTVRCLPCGPGVEDRDAQRATHHPSTPPTAPTAEVATVQLVQSELPRAGVCDDCGRRLRRGSEALFAPDGATILCLECVTLDVLHTAGIPGVGARREHARRLESHRSRVRTTHPRLGGLILALRDDPAHVRAWQTGAVGEEEFGRRLSGIASEKLKVLHDRRLPRSSANIDHLAVTSEAIWVLDAKHYKGKVETRGHGWFSRQPSDLYVGGRNQMRLIEGVKRQVDVVQSILSALATEHGTPAPMVRGGLVFIGAEFGLLPSPFAVDGVWIGWGTAIRKRLAGQTGGDLPVVDIAKRLARELSSS